MADINQAYQDAKGMSDQQLQQELASPTGMVPGYIIMGELQDRAGIRAGGQMHAQQPSMKDQMLASMNSYMPNGGYATGGLIRNSMLAQYTPLRVEAQMLHNPKTAGQFMQALATPDSGGLPALQPLPALSSPQPLAPSQPGSALQQPQSFARGGIVSLLRGR